MKRKSLATLLSGFLTVCLTGVGFASWLITGGETKTSNAGAVSAEKVEDQRVKITNLKVDNAAIAFGMGASTTTNTTPWLKNSDSVEDLTATLSFDVSNGKSFGKEINFTFEVDDAHETDFNTAVTKGYIQAPVLTKITDFGDSDDATTYTVDVVFKWGSFFGGANPYTYFNNTYTTASETSKKTEFADKNAGDEAADVLGAIYKLNGATYTITVETVAKDA